MVMVVTEVHACCVGAHDDSGLTLVFLGPIAIMVGITAGAGSGGLLRRSWTGGRVMCFMRDGGDGSLGGVGGGGRW